MLTVAIGSTVDDTQKAAYVFPAFHLGVSLYRNSSHLKNMAKNQIQMPSGTAGITRYFDEYRSKLTIQPEHVIVITILVGVLVAALHILGKGLLRVA